MKMRELLDEAKTDKRSLKNGKAPTTIDLEE
jgi:hypothetical protein